MAWLKRQNTKDTLFSIESSILPPTLIANYKIRNYHRENLAISYCDTFQKDSSISVEIQTESARYCYMKDTRYKILTARVLWILLHINRRFLCPWLPINPFLLLRLLLVDASAGLSQFLGDIVQTRFRFRFGILTTLSETARYHVLDRVISSRNGLALVFIDFGGPWRRCSRRRPLEKLRFYREKSILGFTECGADTSRYLRVRFRWLITPGLTLLSHFLHLSALKNRLHRGYLSSSYLSVLSIWSTDISHSWNFVRSVYLDRFFVRRSFQVNLV